jgi:hypothetical protein
MPPLSRAIRATLKAAALVVALAVDFGLPWNRAVWAADPPPAPGGKMLMIVAPQKFREALDEYVRFKKQYLPTEIVSLEDVLQKTEGVDDPEKLKRFFYDAWRNRHLGYVLLVGDRDVMPVRYITTDRNTPAAFDYAFYPSDLYYGDVAKDDGSFDNWNAQHQGFHAQYFGEVRGEKNKRDPINYDHIHYRCQVAVGRWPVSNAKQLKTVVDKSMKYESGVRDGTHAGLRKAAMFNVQGFEDDRGPLDKIAHALPRDWKAEEFFYQDKDPRYETAMPDPLEILDALNRGTTLAVHVGHGASRDWASPRDRPKVGPVFSVRSIAQLKNADRLPVMFSIGCSTAYFAPLGPYEAYTDSSGVEHKGTDHGEVFSAPPPPPAPYQKRRIADSLGKALLISSPNGAVGYIGCNTGGQGCAITLLEGFTAGLAHGRTCLGDCWVYAISYYYDRQHLATLAPNNDWYPPVIFFQSMKYMVYADPSLPLAPPPR